jgi:hypothetical protein
MNNLELESEVLVDADADADELVTGLHCVLSHIYVAR